MIPFIFVILVSVSSCCLIQQSKTISFNTNGGASIDDISLLEGTSAAKPTDPAKGGFVFGGWYSDSSLTSAVTEIPAGSTCNVDLYAKWTVNINTAYTVRQYQQDISGTGYTVFTGNTTHISRVSTVNIAGDGSLELKHHLRDGPIIGIGMYR